LATLTEYTFFVVTVNF